jgi:hypothetical protein
VTTDLRGRRHSRLAPADRWDTGDEPGPDRATGEPLPPPNQVQAPDHRFSAGRWLSRHPAWPVTALLVGYPLWWALGMADFAWIFLAVPMASRMLAWRKHRTRQLKLPPGMGAWAVFLLWTMAGISMISLTAPGTLPGSVSNRAISFAVRASSYLAVTVLLLYVGNLTEKELSRRKLAWLVGLLAVYATGLGAAGMLLPHLSFTSPSELLLPGKIRSNTFIQASMHPALAQVQDVFGTGQGQGRPKAPFDYTNIWGECLSISAPWLLVAAYDHGTRRQRMLAWGTLFTGLIVLVYSLNRGVWLGVGLAVAYIGVRFAARGKIAVLGGLTAGLAVLVLVVLLSPLQGVITQRLANGKSNTIRSTLSSQAFRDSLASPVLGYGGTRKRQGSANSITSGPTPDCPQCGQQEVGSTGQLWLLLITSGIVGTLLYIAFFARVAWAYRRDRTAYGMAGWLVLLLSFFYLLTYNVLPAPLGIMMLAVGLLWRNDLHLREQRALGRAPRQVLAGQPE